MTVAGALEGLIVLGAPRSGTTLLRRLLDAHPDVACPPETCLFGAAARMLEEEEIVDGLPVGVVSGLSFAGFGEDEVVGRVRDLCLGFLRDYATRRQKRFWAEKSALDAFHAPEIAALVGDRAAYVAIVRHPLDVIVSMRDLVDAQQRYVHVLHRYVVANPRPLEAFAQAWVDVVAGLRAVQGAHPERTVWIRYEDLVADPLATVGRALAPLGLVADPGLVDRALEGRTDLGFGDWRTWSRGAVDDRSVGRWRGLSPQTLGDLVRIVGPTMAACGYEVPPVPPRPKATDARRRFRAQLMVARSKR